MTDTAPESEAAARIIVVEDERIVAFDIRNQLVRLGYVVVAITSSAEGAIEHVREAAGGPDAPDLALMDIHLQGDMDGIAASAILHDEFQIPVILLTAFADEETIERAKLTEPYAYILKPFEQQELRTAVILALYRARMERRLRAREQLLERILAAISSGVIVNDRAGIVHYANERSRMILAPEGPMPRLVGRPLSSVIPEDVGSAVRADAVSLRWSPQSAPDRTIELARAQMDARSDDDPSEVWVLRDVTEEIANRSRLREKEQQLARAERMETVGRMSGGLAHDFNNLVTVIMGYMRLVLDDLSAHPELETIRRNAEGVFQTAKRSAELTRQLLTLSRAQQTEVEQIVPDRLLEENRSILSGFAPPNVQLEIKLQADGVCVLMDRSRFEQTVFNLVLNARDAMPDGGLLVVSTELVHAREGLETFGRTLEPGAYLRVRVSDSGAGIREEDLSRVFEPFFSTKGSDHPGSGFGLATAYSAVGESGGGITVSSIIGQGTVFSIYLRVAASTTSEPGEAVSDPSDFHGWVPRILLVESDAPSRSVLTSLLEGQGCRIVAARSVGDGLLALERYLDTHIILSDLSAPYLSTTEVVRRYRQLAPEAAVILISSQEEPDAGQEATLVKPFEPPEITRLIAQCMDGR